MIYINDQWASRWGLDWLKLDPGSYTVSFGDVNGFIKPAPQVVTIQAGGVITLCEGVYTPAASLQVVTNPPVPGTVYVNGIPRNDWGFWNYVPAGTYTVTFGPVPDMAPPAPQTVTVVPGEYRLVWGNYTSSPGAPGADMGTLGWLRVYTNPAVPIMIYIDGQWSSYWGLNWVKVAPGQHWLTFSELYGIVKPAPISVNVTAGGITTQEVSIQLTGTLRVVSSPPVPTTIFVNSIPRNEWGIWVDVAPGTYTVSFGAVPGMVTPAPQVAVVTASLQTDIVGTFVAG
jgi:hypothetical protein